MNPRLLKRPTIHIIATVIAVMLLVIAELLVGLEEEREQGANRRAAAAEVEQLAMLLDDALADSSNLASSLAIYAEDRSRFGERYSATLHLLPQRDPDRGEPHHRHHSS